MSLLYTVDLKGKGCRRRFCLRRVPVVDFSSCMGVSSDGFVHLSLYRAADREALVLIGREIQGSSSGWLLRSSPSSTRAGACLRASRLGLLVGVLERLVLGLKSRDLVLKILADLDLLPELALDLHHVVLELVAPRFSVVKTLGEGGLLRLGGGGGGGGRGALVGGGRGRLVLLRSPIHTTGWGTAGVGPKCSVTVGRLRSLLERRTGTDSGLGSRHC
ncbi:hypothetical protein BKA80DRAFT_261271, partial [Phyllosticta citrichinensis]